MNVVNLPKSLYLPTFSKFCKNFHIMNISIGQKFLSVIFITALLASCQPGNKPSEEIKSKRAGINEVIVHETADFDKMNVITSTSNNAGIVTRTLFPALLAIHREVVINRDGVIRMHGIGIKYRQRFF